MSATDTGSALLKGLSGPFTAATSTTAKIRSNQPAAPFSLRLTPRERAEIEEQAGGKPLGAYIRSQLLEEKQEKRRSARRPSIDEAVLARSLAELGKSRLASNMNQIAKAANIGVLDVNSDMISELRSACRDIRKMRDALIDALGLKVEGSE